MKCDELKYEKLGDMMPFYPRSTLVIRKQFVDAAIDELKREHHKERHEYIDMVAQLKAKLVEQESENRKLKRALWLSRAKRAKARKNYWYVRSIHEGDKDLWSIDGSVVKYIGCIKRSNFDWLKIWSEVECKCLAKAEEYK